MLPALRALADRLIWDVANVRSVVERLPRGGLERRPAEGGRTLREIVAHLAAHQQALAQEALAVARGEAAAAADERAKAQLAPALPLAESLAVLAAARDTLIATLEPLTAAQLEQTLGNGMTFGQLLEQRSRHLAHHSLDFADALPELRFDPMVLNWVLYADCGDDADLGRRQARLLAEVRERFASEPEDLS